MGKNTSLHCSASRNDSGDPGVAVIVVTDDTEHCTEHLLPLLGVVRDCKAVALHELEPRAVVRLDAARRT